MITGDDLRGLPILCANKIPEALAQKMGVIRMSWQFYAQYQCKQLDEKFLAEFDKQFYIRGIEYECPEVIRLLCHSELFREVIRLPCHSELFSEVPEGCDAPVYDVTLSQQTGKFSAKVVA